MAAGKKSGKKSQASNDFLEPQAVTGLTGTDVGTSRPYLLTANTTSEASAAGTGGAVDLSWTLPANSPAATSYTITTTPSTYTEVTGNTNTTYRFEGLASGVSYTFTVVGTNAAGSSIATTSSSVTSTTVPQAPQSASAVAGVDKDTISWTAGATGGKAISSYSITSSDGKSFTGISSSPYEPTQEANTSQSYTVFALNSNGTSLGSTTGSVTTLPPAFFAPPYFPPFFPPFFPPYFPPFFPPFFPPRFFSPPFFSR
jgi:titin